MEPDEELVISSVAGLSLARGHENGDLIANIPQDPNTCYGKCFAVSASDLARIARPDKDVSTLPPDDSHGTESEPYVYSPVKAWEIRVLELFPSSDRHTTLRGRLIPATIAMQAGRQVAVTTASEDSTIVPFRALSYTWGSLKQDCTILLDDKALGITANLHSALVELRDKEKPVYLWADGVCIHQASNQEKSHQVTNMLQIYQTADLVEVWLGPAQDGSDLAMAYLQRFSHDDVTELSRTHTQECIAHAYHHLWSPLLELCNRAWLRRTWIRQEVYAAKALNVHCGSCILPWSSFLKSFSVLWLLTSLLPSIDRHEADRASSAIRLLPELYSNSDHSAGPSGSKSPRNLVEVLATSDEYEVTEERDKVFAVLGMCGVAVNSDRDKDKQGTDRPAKSPSVTVDYEKPVSQIWNDISKYIFDTASLQEPDTFTVGEAIRRNKENEYGEEHYEYPQMSKGDVLDVLQSSVADLLNLSNSANCGVSKTLAEAAPSQPRNPPWSLRSVASRAADDTAILRSLQLPLVNQPSLHTSSATGQRQSSGHKASGGTGVLPSPKLEDSFTLRVRGILTGCVAEVTNYTCSLSDFSAAVAANSKHISETKIKPFSASIDDRRLGFITLFRTLRRWDEFDSEQSMLPQLSLLPADSQSGDLLTSVADNVLPLVIRPRSDTYLQMLASILEWKRDFLGFKDPAVFIHDQPSLFRDCALEKSWYYKPYDHKTAVEEWRRVRERFWDAVPPDNKLLGPAIFALLRWDEVHARKRGRKDLWLH